MSTDDIEDRANLPKFERLGYKDQVLDIINSLELSSETDKHILKSRFLYEVLNYDARRDHTKRYYNVFRFAVAVGSILLPALLSIGQMDPAKLPRNFDQISYWSTWSISLTVTICNGFLQLFSLDKNYFEYAITSEQLKTEGWQFFQLSGKYDEYPDHATAYRSFCKSIENIKRKQVEKEFSGKGESKKKKEFNCQKELEKALPEQFGGDKKVESASKQLADINMLSMLSKLAPDQVQAFAKGLGGVQETVEEVSEGVESAKKLAKEVAESLEESQADSVTPS